MGLLSINRSAASFQSPPSTAELIRENDVLRRENEELRQSATFMAASSVQSGSSSRAPSRMSESSWRGQNHPREPSRYAGTSILGGVRALPGSKHLRFAHVCLYATKTLTGLAPPVQQHQCLAPAAVPRLPSDACPSPMHSVATYIRCSCV